MLNAVVMPFATTHPTTASWNNCAGAHNNTAVLTADAVNRMQTCVANSYGVSVVDLIMPLDLIIFQTFYLIVRMFNRCEL
jgi:hypothetical protein